MSVDMPNAGSGGSMGMDAQVDGPENPSDAGQSDSGTQDAGTDSGKVEPPLPPVECEPTSADSAVGIFVSLAPVGTSNSNCGAAALPCATIALGMERALQLGREFVYLDAGSYTEEVTLSPGLVLKGGWDNIGGTWTRHCANDPEKLARINSPTNLGVLAEYDGTAGLDTLSVRTLTTAGSGQSVYGVIARGSTTTLKLNRVVIEAAAGGAGKAGEPGLTPLDPPATTCKYAGDGMVPPAGSDGATGAASSVDSHGFQTSVAEGGQPGETGHNGAAASGRCEDCVKSGSCTDNSGTTTCAGAPSGGQSCSTAGQPGCGGAPGAGGTGGQGGGSSVALFVWDAHVEIKASLLISGDGGAGALGGDGGDGGPGSAGSAGTPGVTCYLCRRGFIISTGTSASASSAIPAAGASDAVPAIGPIIPILPCTTQSTSAPAVTGNTGAKGSHGGRGGDGAGGSSYSLYHNGSATITQEANQFVHGNAGTSQGSGPAGEAADIGS